MMHAAAVPLQAPGPSESALVDRVRRGDREAEYALYHLHAPRIHRLVFRLCGDAALTDDLLQDAFVRAFSRLDLFRGDAAFGTWLHRIAINLTLNARRSTQRRDRWIGEMPDDIAAPAEPALDHDFQRSFNEAVDTLSPGQREVFVMHTLEGYTHVEIGEILGISEGTSKGRLFHARARLRQLLARFAPEQTHG